MTIELSADQRDLQQAAVELARRELGHDLRRRDRDGAFDREGFRKVADFGLLRMPVAEEHGGLGLGLTDVLAVSEGLGYGSRDLGLLFALQAHLWTAVLPLVEHGTREQLARFLPALIDGRQVAANAASEPGAGSDVFSLATRAERRGEVYVLNGVKTFVTNARDADLFVVYATVDPRLGAMGVTAFLVPRELPGLSLSREIEKMGLRTSSMAEVVLADCEVPVANRLGREGMGGLIFDGSMEWERGSILAGCLGRMRAQLEQCLAYARERRQFGQPIGKFQAVSHRIADMKVRLDACRPLVYRIGALKDAGKPARLEAAVAKLQVSESFIQSSIDAMRTYGGYGYMVEQEVERELRDALGGVFYSGTSDVQRNVIARELGL